MWFYKFLNYAISNIKFIYSFKIYFSYIFHNCSKPQIGGPLLQGKTYYSMDNILLIKFQKMVSNEWAADNIFNQTNLEYFDQIHSVYNRNYIWKLE